jgi:hypothetical protein
MYTYTNTTNWLLITSQYSVNIHEGLNLQQYHYDNLQSHKRFTVEDTTQTPQRLQRSAHSANCNE